MNKEYYAHSKEGEPPSEWHRLNEHLQEVAKMARSFAEGFGAGDWACMAGLWHDVGKYTIKKEMGYGRLPWNSLRI